MSQVSFTRRLYLSGSLMANWRLWNRSLESHHFLGVSSTIVIYESAALNVCNQWRVQPKTQHLYASRRMNQSIGHGEILWHFFTCIFYAKDAGKPGNICLQSVMLGAGHRSFDDSSSPSRQRDAPATSGIR